MRAAIGLAAPLLVAGALRILVPLSIYLWLKAFHLVAVFGWMGGMIGVVYLLAWHARAEAGSPQAAMLSGLERRACSSWSIRRW